MRIGGEVGPGGTGSMAKHAVLTVAMGACNRAIHCEDRGYAVLLVALDAAPLKPLVGEAHSRQGGCRDVGLAESTSREEAPKNRECGNNIKGRAPFSSHTVFEYGEIY